MRSIRLLLALLLAAAANPAGAALFQSCPSASDAPQPAWVTRAQPIAGFYTGIGQAELRNQPLPQQMERAKQAALRDLAGNVQVYVRSELKIVEKGTQAAAGSFESTANVEAITESAADALIGDVTVDATWIDPETCVLWLRIKAPEEVILRLQRKQAALAKLKLLRQLIAAGEDAAADPDRRETTLAQAESLAAQIEYPLAEDGSTREQFAKQIARARDTLGEVYRGRSRYGEQFRRAQGLLQQAREAGSESERAARVVSARDLLAAIARGEPFGRAPDFWAEQALWELALFETQAGHSCEALAYLKNLQAKTPDPQWSEKAGVPLAQLKCSPEAREAAAWRALVFGRPAKVYCAYRTPAETGAWARACVEAAAVLAAAGAQRIETFADNPVDALKVAKRCGGGCAADAAVGSGIAILLTAEGSLAQRASSQNPLGKDWQFRGDIATVLLKDGAPVLTDRYSGVSGWNPVSRDMTLEVVALQMMRRLRDKVSGQYRPGD